MGQVGDRDVVLIDDARMFRGYSKCVGDFGTECYPTLDDLREVLCRRQPTWSFLVEVLSLLALLVQKYTCFTGTKVDDLREALWRHQPTWSFLVEIFNLLAVLVQQYTCFTSTRVFALLASTKLCCRRQPTWSFLVEIPQFTCFTGTKVQILTPAPRLEDDRV